ncbi:hypothetical protein GS3922_01645 [Geobacillus subterraneus]|uniref:Uncharacterized protein n=1 Tax=Geobacillus subterraneus TaxID=129338 RepID=A0ABN4NDP4_9BACL|nr:hypothetical protein GS3922_01645 [Geobacillus subterraneus]
MLEGLRGGYAAAAGPKRREPMAAGARQYEKRKRRDRLSKPNVLHPQGCLHPEGEGYLAEESQALELDNTKREGRERPTINKSRFRFVQF